MSYFWFAAFFVTFLILIGKQKTIKKLRNQRPEKIIEKEYVYVDSEPKRKRNSTSEDDNEYDWTSFATKPIDSKHLRPQKNLYDSGHFFSGKKVVITGNFNHFVYKDELAKLLWEVGADVDTSVSKRTNYLIKGNDPGWKKLEKADEYGVKVLTEMQFLEIFPDYKSPYL